MGLHLLCVLVAVRSCEELLCLVCACDVGFVEQNAFWWE